MDGVSEYVLFFMIIVIASFLQTSTGFGFSIMAIPFLLLLFEPRDAIQLNLILTFLISVFLIRNVKKDVDWGMFKRLVTGSIIGLPVGILIFAVANVTYLKLGIGLLLLIFTALLMANFRVKQTSKRDLSAGSFSGLLTSSIGMPGPPLLLYLSGTDTEKTKLRSTTLAFYLFIYIVSLASQIAVVGTSVMPWKLTIIALPLVLAGLYLGQILFHKMNEKVFRTLTYGILLATGGYLLIDFLLGA